ncbi:MAG TPA: type IV pilus twitching motility protein PilT [Polyangia bacterium]
MAKHRGEALILRGGAPIELVIRGTARPATAKPVTDEQIMGLLTEALGASYAAGVSGQRTYNYSSAAGPVQIAVDDSPMGFSVRVSPAPGTTLGAGAGVPTTPAAPVPVRVDAEATPSPSMPSISIGGGLAGGSMGSGPVIAMPPAPPPPSAPVAPARPAPSAAVSVGQGPGRAIDELFHHMLDLKASDMHLKSEKAPMVRVDGSMAHMPDRGPLSSAVLAQLLESIMPDRNRVEFAETNDTDFAYELPDKTNRGAIRARMRCNVFRDIVGVGAVFRQIPSKILTAEDLKLPRACLDFCQFDKGLVVVTGPTGSGKSTTLAAMVDWINANRDDHIITIEDPVEFVHKDKKCHINQREVGTQTKSFKAALRAALREDPDIVLVGEMRDLETVAIAIETAETGHLVFGTLHTNTAPSTVDRLIDQFPTDRQSQIRIMLSESLKGVVAQTLLKRKTGGRVAALEILVVTHAVANLIREGKTFQIPSLMQTGRGLGMMTLTDSLAELVKNDVVEPQEAYDRAPNKKEFAIILNRMGAKGPWNEEKTT